MQKTRQAHLIRLVALLGSVLAPPAFAGALAIDCYRLRAPGNTHDIEQASGLTYGRIGHREGLWLVCDRNGGNSGGSLHFIAKHTLARAVSGEIIVADETFLVAFPKSSWSDFAAAHKAVSDEVLAEVRNRIQARLEQNGGPLLDLEAVAVAPSPAPPYEPRVFVAAEEPFSTVLELAVPDEPGAARAHLMAIYGYPERQGEQGIEHNDGLEGLAYAGKLGVFYWCEEGTRLHEGGLRHRPFFLDPRIGKATLTRGRMTIDVTASEAMTAAVRRQRQGSMQTLNGLTTMPDGTLLAVDRNGGWILQVDPKHGTTRRWLNLYDLNGTNLRVMLTAFPHHRRMGYISIEGIALDPSDVLWLVDDPAMPEAFRASCLVRIAGLDIEPTKRDR